ncbi:branched-chain amino acid aminotransferase II [Clathrospora elynae]|uniref:Branched-chain amino acid aminotransferase II n=1 Tax=Clathrospora elynae TaxID=706981 RepID=A0A6A5SBL6_9PLEO|nr:branched-chain amino acid aminotransferase II [Clathrospora elynae]
MAPPPAPLTTIDWSTLTLNVPTEATLSHPIPSHVETTFSLTTEQWTPPTVHPSPYLQIHGLSPALNYGMQAFEGLKATRHSNDTITVFRPDFHHRRLTHSATTIALHSPPLETFLTALNLLIRSNAHLLGPASSSAILYIRPLLIPTSPHLSLTPVPETVTLAVYAHPATTYLGVRPIPACISTTYDRAAPLGTGHAKIGGNYASGILPAQAAMKRGFPMQLFLDARTRTEIEEFSSSGFVGITSDGTVVIPDSKQVIASVTSDTLQSLAAKSLGWKVERRRVPVEELASFKEVIAVGTAVSVLPIASITNEETGEKFVYCENGEAGPAAKKLNEAIGEAIRGSGEDRFGWRYEVTFPDEVEAEVNGSAMTAKDGAEVKVEELQAVGAVP